MKGTLQHVLVLFALALLSADARKARLLGKPHKSSGLCDADMAALRMRTPPEPWLHGTVVATAANTMANVTTVAANAMTPAPQLVETASYIKVVLGEPNLKSPNSATNGSVVLSATNQEPKPKLSPTYKYVGCYTINNPEEQFLKPGPPGSATAMHHVKEMTVSKCFNWCHEQKVRGVETGDVPAFFELKAGKECSCLPYLWKSKDIIYPCDQACSGHDGNMCGGFYAHSVYAMVECPGSLPVHNPMVHA